MQKIQANVTGRVPFSERLTCSVDEAAGATGLSRSLLYERMKSGDLEFRKHGTRRLIVVASLKRLIGLS